LKSVESNLQIIKEKIAKACEKVGRDSQDVTIIAVTKYVTIARAQEALRAGVIHLGENRDQELLKKYEVLGNQPVWHFIGTLQTRKVKKIIDKVDFIHSLDRLSLAEEIDKRANRKISCFVQVNVSGEESKHGLPPEEVVPFIQQLAMYANVEIVGLMTMAPFVKDEQILRNCFRSLKQLQNDIQNLKLPYAPCTELSMGMSNDYEIAVEEGATFVRIGTSLVGE